MLIRLLFIIIFIFGCKTEPVRQEIEVGKTIKIEPSNFSINDNELLFLWSTPNGPKKSKANYKIENNKMLFTPDIEGEYEISLMIESRNNNSIYEETFLYSASKNKDHISSTQGTNYKETIKNNIGSKKYTIQVASWPSLEQARIDQIKLRENGYDAYTEQYYIKSKDQLWWRVRVGNFSDKRIAIQVKNKLSKERGNDLWIDFIN